MLNIHLHKVALRLTQGLLAWVALITVGLSQGGFVYSTDYKGPIQGSQSQGGGQAPLIHESDLIAPPLNGAPGIGPLPPPIVVIDGATLGLPLFGQCGNPTPGIPCKIEVDAFSRGRDSPITIDDSGVGLGHIFFSVDEYARGIPSPLVPNVSSESFVGEASADVFTFIGALPGPVPPPQAGQPFGNIAVLDGNGMPSQNGFVYPGIGCREPNDSQQGPLNSGDNLDAMDRFPQDQMPAVSLEDPAFFSLDGGLFDPEEQIFGGGSASANSTQTVYTAADILMTVGAGALPVVYASAASLGLTGDLDDIDALALWDNGDGIFQVSTFPYEWKVDNDGDGVGDTDMLIFSVRRGSDVIGKPDSIFGLPIQAGDLLVPPVTGGHGFGPAHPGIFISAEALGLRADRENNHGSDDLDSVDVGGDPYFDCNDNGTDDSTDIANGSSEDLNHNGTPDECEDFVEFCNGDGSATASPCGNDNDASLGIAGTANGVSSGGAAMRASGTGSVLSSDFKLDAEGLVPGQPGLFFQGNNMINGSHGNSFGDGLRCAGGSVVRLEVRFASSTGEASTTIDLILKGGVSAGDVRSYQLWYRNPTGGSSGSPCGTGFNLSNGVRGSFSS